MLYYLDEHADTASMRDVTERIAAWEHGKTIRTLGSDERQRVYISLYQNHLPKLDEHGVIAYDKSRGTVERTELADQFDRYIRGAPHSEPTVRQTIEMDHERAGQSRLVRTAGVGTVGASVLIGSWLNLVPASVLLALLWIALCVASLPGTVDGIDSALETDITSDE